MNLDVRFENTHCSHNLINSGSERPSREATKDKTMRVQNLFTPRQQGRPRPRNERDGASRSRPSATTQEVRSAIVDFLSLIEVQESLNRRTSRSRSVAHRLELNSLQDLSQLGTVSRLLESLDEFERTATAFQEATSNQKKKLSRTSDQAIAELPRVRMLPADKERYKDDDTECSICCERLIDGMCLTRLPCGHTYHMNCSVRWLIKSNTCPSCRYELESNDADKEPTRKELMKGRTIYSCKCPPHASHNCILDEFEARLKEKNLSGGNVGCNGQSHRCCSHETSTASPP